MNKKDSREIEGATVEEAIQKALAEFRLPKKKLKIKVLAEEEKGLFGMPGARPAKIRVTIIKEKENT